MFIEGIQLLNSYCKKKIHTHNPTTMSDHQWSLAKIYRYSDMAPQLKNTRSYTTLQGVNDKERETIA